MNRTLFLPYINSKEYLSQIPNDAILYGRFEDDFQKECLLFTESKQNCITITTVDFLIRRGFKLCYVYDMFHFENKEFTVDGYKKLEMTWIELLTMDFHIF